MGIRNSKGAGLSFEEKVRIELAAFDSYYERCEAEAFDGPFLVDRTQKANSILYIQDPSLCVPPLKLTFHVNWTPRALYEKIRHPPAKVISDDSNDIYYNWCLVLEVPPLELKDEIGIYYHPLGTNDDTNSLASHGLRNGSVLKWMDHCTLRMYHLNNFTLNSKETRLRISESEMMYKEANLRNGRRRRRRNDRETVENSGE